MWTAAASLAASISDRPQDGSTVHDGDVVGTDGDFIGFISIYMWCMCVVTLWLENRGDNFKSHG